MTLYYAVRFDLDVRNDGDKVYRPALSMVRKDGQKLVPSNGSLANQ
jgi:hypothetical protein